MKLDNVFKKTKFSPKHMIPLKRQEMPEVPEGLLRKCNRCGSAIFTEETKKNFYVCPRCGGYFRMSAGKRLALITDSGSFTEWDAAVTGENPLHYKGYPEKIQVTQEKTGLQEAVVTGKATIGGKETVLAVCDGRFLMASMGEAVGEKIVRAVERATLEKLPVIIFACSGGARMQEGILSLMQMAKTAAAIKRHSAAGLLYISVLTDPTMGGVTASFAMLGDIILAEPNALIGFAGPRVIAQTIGQKLPEGFQTSEFLLEHGFVDAIVKREELKQTLTELLCMHERKKNDKTQHTPKSEQEQYAADIRGLSQTVESTLQRTCDEQRENGVQADHAKETLTPWQRVECSRKRERPSGMDYIARLFTHFQEMHGDRLYADDAAIVGGIACFHGTPVTVIAQVKGHDTKENIRRNFAMPSPEGYRKALRLMKQAEKFHRPIICFVDTPGAFCGIGAEERGQGEAIARNIYEMSALTVPVLSIVIGEGGSGGALAMAVADEVWLLKNAIYSILSPEGFASILWKDSSRAKEAADVMRLTADDLWKLGIAEQIFEEPEPLTRETMDTVTETMKQKIDKFLTKYGAMSIEELQEHRYRRFRNF